MKARISLGLRCGNGGSIEEMREDGRAFLEEFFKHQNLLVEIFGPFIKDTFDINKRVFNGSNKVNGSKVCFFVPNNSGLDTCFTLMICGTNKVAGFHIPYTKFEVQLHVSSIIDALKKEYGKEAGL